MTARGRLVRAAVAAIIAAVLAGCSPTSTAGVLGPATALPSATVRANASSVTVRATAPSAGVDACAVLTAEEIAQVIGTNSGPKGDGGHCSWENTDNYHSVTLDIGDTGTAPDGQLPPPLPGAATAPGPDGIRYSSGNVAEFLIGDRACQIQVVTSVSDDSDRPTAVRLIGVIRQRVHQ